MFDSTRISLRRLIRRKLHVIVDASDKDMDFLRQNQRLEDFIPLGRTPSERTATAAGILVRMIDAEMLRRPRSARRRTFLVNGAFEFVDRVRILRPTPYDLIMQNMTLRRAYFIEVRCPESTSLAQITLWSLPRSAELTYIHCMQLISAADLQLEKCREQGAREMTTSD